MNTTAAIASVHVSDVTRRALLGARLDDPVQPAAPRTRSRLRRNR